MKTIKYFLEDRELTPDEIEAFQEDMSLHDSLIMIQQHFYSRFIKKLIPESFPDVKVYQITVVRNDSVPAKAFLFLNCGDMEGFKKIYGRIAERYGETDGWYSMPDPRLLFPTCIEIPKTDKERFHQRYRLKWYIDEDDSFLYIRTMNTREKEALKAVRLKK